MNKVKDIFRISSPRKLDLLLFAAATLLFLIAIGYAVFAVRSLAARAAAAFLRSEPPPAPGATFEFDKLEPLIEAGKIERQ